VIEVAEAVRRLLDEAAPLEPVELPLDECSGRVLARTVFADRDFPSTDRSAMDGYAVRTADLPGPGVVLALVGELPAGRPAEGIEVGRGQAVRVFTGSVVPNGADAVVMKELAEEGPEPGTVRIRSIPAPGENIRRRAEELGKGQPVLEAGRPIGPAQIGALAAVGSERVVVFRPPRVFLLSTGDEVVPVSSEPAPHQVRNSNAHALAALLRELALEPILLGIAPDEQHSLEEKIRAGLSGDLLVVTGGMSVGETDLVASALAAQGMRLLFHKVNMRPGKPILAGRCGGSLVLGLPGNPVSAFVGFVLFGVPVLRRMLGYRQVENLALSATLAERLPRRPGRPGYALVHAFVEEGSLLVRPVRTAGSGDVLSLARANALVPTEPSPHALPEGSEVRAILWRDFHLFS